MRRILIFLSLMCVVPGYSAHALEAVASHAVFFKGDDAAELEIFWQAIPSSLHYHKNAEGLISARIQAKLRISNDTGIVFTDAVNVESKPFDPAKETAPPVFDLSKADIPEGHLKIELYLSDGHAGGDFYYKDTITVQPESGPFYSTVELVDTLVKDKNPGRFGKGEYLQLPKPLPFYDEGRRSFHSYMELYKTAKLPASAFPLFQEVWLSHRQKEKDIPHFSVLDTVRSASPMLALRNNFSLAPLESGNYYLNVRLTDAAGTVLAETGSFFQLVNKHPEGKRDTVVDNLPDPGSSKSILDLSKTFIAKYDMPQLRAILKMMQPGADPTEANAIRNFLSRPDEVYMRYFIYNHFAAENKADPARAWKLFSDKVREANKYYNSGSTMGYETDRGIIYLRYGEPAEVIRVPNEPGAQPYEIWRYNAGGKIPGSGVFLFYSPGMMRSDYRLLNSTVRGEHYNPDWRGALYVNGQSNGNTTSQAEEYFK